MKSASSGWSRFAACLIFLSTSSSFAHLAGNAAPDLFRQLRNEWALNLHDKRVDAWVAEYAEDGDFVQPDGRRVHGTTALRNLFATITATFDSDLTFDSLRVEKSGNLAYDSGTYRETLVVRATHKQQHSKGSYLTVYRRNAAGAWLIVEQAWTGSVQ